MSIEKRIDRLEEQPEYKPPEALLVEPRMDGTFSDVSGRVYTQEQLDELGAGGTRVVIWTPHKPKGGKLEQ